MITVIIKLASKITTMKFTSFFTCFLLLYFFSIGGEIKAQPVKSLENDSITAITVSRSFPWMTNDGKLLSYETEKAFIFYKQDLVLYKIPYVHKIFKLSDSSIYEVDKVEERTKYFICQKGSPIGYFTDSSLNIYFLQCPTDSLTIQFWPMHPFMGSVFDKNDFHLIDSLTYCKENSHYKTYSFQNKTDASQKGTYYLEYTDSFPVVDYSISPRLDTANGMKLTNIEILNEARYIKEYNVTIDAVKQNRKITLFRDFSMPEITPFFEYMKKSATK